MIVQSSWQLWSVVSRLVSCCQLCVYAVSYVGQMLVVVNCCPLGLTQQIYVLSVSTHLHTYTASQLHTYTPTCSSTLLNSHSANWTRSSCPRLAVTGSPLSTSHVSRGSLSSLLPMPCSWGWEDLGDSPSPVSQPTWLTTRSSRYVSSTPNGSR